MTKSEKTQSEKRKLLIFGFDRLHKVIANKHNLSYHVLV